MFQWLNRLYSQEKATFTLQYKIVSVHFYYLINSLSPAPQDHLAPSLAARYNDVPSRNSWYGDGTLFEMA